MDWYQPPSHQNVKKKKKASRENTAFHSSLFLESWGGQEEKIVIKYLLKTDCESAASSSQKIKARERSTYACIIKYCLESKSLLITTQCFASSIVNWFNPITWITILLNTHNISLLTLPLSPIKCGLFLCSGLIGLEDFDKTMLSNGASGSVCNR